MSEQRAAFKPGDTVRMLTKDEIFSLFPLFKDDKHEQFCVIGTSAWTKSTLLGLAGREMIIDLVETNCAGDFRYYTKELFKIGFPEQLLVKIDERKIPNVSVDALREEWEALLCR